MLVPSAVSTAAFVLIVLALCALFVFGSYRADRALGAQPASARSRAARVLFVLLGWLALTGVASASGVLEKPVLPPPLAVFFMVSLAVAVIAARSALGTRMVQGLPIAALVLAQAFRLPLELVLHAWKNQGVIPVQMTYEGHNFDIVTGVLAIVAGAVLLNARAQSSRSVVLAFNLVGSALLLAVMAIAVLSSPLPIRAYPNDPPLLLGYHFPYGWIVPVCVGGALFGHVLVFRWLRWTARREHTHASDAITPATSGFLRSRNAPATERA